MSIHHRAVIVFSFLLYLFEFESVVEGKYSILRQDQWPLYCSISPRQSPIDIPTGSAVKNNTLKLKVRNYKKKFDVLFENTENTIKMFLAPNTRDSAKPYVSNIYGKEKYIFSHQQYSWPSSHTLDGKSYILESHFIHYAEKYGTLANAATKSDGIVIVALFFKTSSSNNPDIENVIKLMPQIAEQPKNVARINSTRIDGCFPKRCNWSFYRYNGSYLWPDCPESVTWIVLKKKSYVTFAQVESLKNIRNENGDMLTHNNKQLRPVNGREIYYKKCKLSIFTNSC